MKILIFTLLFTGFLRFAWSQSVNYEDLFGDDWKKATIYEKENSSRIEPLLAKNHISYPLAIAIVFPELVRYSAIKDEIEIGLLKTLYVNLGKEYSDFSIGAFQMKPSFAETIRDESATYLGRRSGIIFKTPTDYDNIKDFRKSIISDLEDPEGQVIYLITFIKICEKKFNLNRLDEPGLVKFLATAYNFGIDKTALEIVHMTDKKFFSPKLIKTETYSYADVSLFWYNRYVSDK